ncbi:MAG: hypothetical protein JXA49_07625 [Actinobacteria bacterium]|nr:hypothetical protein [Actinomycetota bacterium]
MKGKTGKEMRNLMLMVSISVLLLVLAIVAYFMTDVIITTNRNIERNEELVVEQSVLTLNKIQDSVQNITTDASLFSLFNQELINNLLAGNTEGIDHFIIEFVSSFYPVDYVGVIRDGKLSGYSASDGYEIDPEKMPLESTEEGFEVLESMGGREGYFISEFYELNLKMLDIDEFSVNMIIDRTEDMADVRSYFEGQRNDLVMRLSIAAGIAIVLSLLLTTFGVSYFTRKYVIEPIDELNRAAEEISEGTYKGEVTVDPESAYAALQGLLRSGQKVLNRMDEQFRE